MTMVGLDGTLLLDLIGHADAERLRLAFAAGFSQRAVGEALGAPQQQVGRRAGRVKGV